MKVKGVSSVIRGLAAFGEKGRKAAAQVVQATAMELNAEARSNAPVDMGKLRQSIINNVEESGLRVRVEVGVPYGAYVEFGTGPKVKVPAELQKEALKFKSDGNSGSFDDFLAAIEAWAKRKGIKPKDTETGRLHVDPDEQDYKEMYYFIAVSILKKGLEPRPFLYPAWVKYRKELKPRLAAMLERLAREHNSR